MKIKKFFTAIISFFPNYLSDFENAYDEGFGSGYEEGLTDGFAGGKKEKAYLWREVLEFLQSRGYSEHQTEFTAFELVELLSEYDRDMKLEIDFLRKRANDRDEADV